MSDNDGNNNLNDSNLHYNISLSYTTSDLILHYYLHKIIAPFMFSFLTVTGIIGNTTVAYIILTNKSMRNVTNILLLNLAFSDIALLLICGPFTVYKYATDAWIFGNLACQIIQYVLYVTVYVTIYTLVAISVYRYITIVKGQKLQGTSNHQRRAFYFIASLWIATLLLHVPTLLAHRIKFIRENSPPDEPYVYCGIENSSIEAIFISFFVFGYAVPLLIIATFYLLVVRYLKHNQPFAQQDHESTVRRTTRTCRVILIVVLAFGISWLPHHVNALFSLYNLMPNSKFYMVMRVVWVCMSYANSCVNPFIYNYASSEFRASFRRLLDCRKNSVTGRSSANRVGFNSKFEDIEIDNML